MLDFNPQLNDNGTPRYTWPYVRIWLESKRFEVQKLFPHLTHGNIFGAGSASDYPSCMQANSLMVHCCVDIRVKLSRPDCEDYDLIIKMLTEQMTAYGIALQHYQKKIPNYTPHP